MTVEEALKSALDFEHRVRDHYARAAEKAKENSANRLFAALAIEEQIHVDFLKARLTTWHLEQKINLQELKSAVPDQQWSAEGWQKLKEQNLDRDFSGDLGLLYEALKMEIAVHEHYQKLVDELEGAAKDMFRQFMIIEENHTAFVQAQIYALEKRGVWFSLG